MKFASEYFNGEVRDGFYVQPLMKRVWAAQVEVLEEIDKICTRHNLKYFAVYGTLLGAIRHKGFIPWDDDMDISMLRDDYERFAQLAEKELPDGWRMFDCNDEGFHTRLIRIVNAHGSRLDQEFLQKFHGCPFAIGVDIIPWDNIPDNKSEEETMLRLMSTFDTLAVNWEEYQHDPENAEAMLKNLEEIVGQAFDRTKPIPSQLLHYSDMITAMYWGKKVKYAASADDLIKYPQSRVPVSCFDEIIRLPFENTTIPAIRDYDLMLKGYYGEDYMQPQIRYETHNYPFFIQKLNDLKDFFRKNKMAYPECFSAFVPKDGNPLISIIISCSYTSKYLDRCLQSLLCQTISATNLEIICVDEGLDKELSDTLEKWEKKLCDILTIVRCETEGLSGMARSIGLEYARADYVVFIEASDWVEMDFCECLYRTLQYADFDIVSCVYEQDVSKDLSYFSDCCTGKKSVSLVIDSEEKRNIFLKYYPLGHELFGKLIAKELLTKNIARFSENSTLGDISAEIIFRSCAEKIYLLQKKLYHRYAENSCTI